MDISGFVVLGIVTLFLVYLVPQLIRGRQDVVDSRVGDRFSTDLRILATAGPSTPTGLAAPEPPARAYLHAPRPRTEVSAMDRPLAHVSRPSAPVDTPHARGAGGGSEHRVVGEVAARRRAAARRRLGLTLLLLVVTAAGWFAVALGLVAAGVAVAPTALLGLVLVLGRRAARAAARAASRAVPRSAGVAPSRAAASARAAAAPGAASEPIRARTQSRSQARTSEPVPVDRGTASQPGDRPAADRASREAPTELLPRITAASGRDGDAAPGLTWRGEPTPPVVAEVGDGQGAGPASPAQSTPAAPSPDVAGDGRADDPGDGWTPVPVPAPTYTMKPTAPRMSAAPLALDDPEPRAAGAAAATAPSPAPSAAAAGGPAPTPGLDLDAVLSRRRAAGE